MAGGSDIGNSDISGANGLSLCGEMIQAAQVDLEAIQDRFNVGEVTRTDVQQAEADLPDVRFECRDVSFADYCQKVPALYTEIVKGRQQEAQVGSIPLEQARAIRLKALQIKALCK